MNTKKKLKEINKHLQDEQKLFKKKLNCEFERMNRKWHLDNVKLVANHIWDNKNFRDKIRERSVI